MEDVSRIALFKHQSPCNRIIEDKNILMEKLLHLAVELICLQTEEHYVILKKYGDLNNHCRRSRSSDTMSGTQSFLMELPSPSLVPEDNPILEATNKIIELLTGEVPVRCQDVTVYFSMEEWKYLERHKDLYKDVLMENQQLFGSAGCFKSYSKRSFEKISETGKSGNCRAEAVLNVTKELIDLLTGESYILVKTSRMVTDEQSSGYASRDPIIETFLHPKLPGRNNDKILEAAHKILKLLAGEVPIRCQDVTVHFSVEEWEYLEAHNDLYKDVIMESQQPLISLDESPPANKPDGYPFTPCHFKDGNENLTDTIQSRAGSRGEWESVNYRESPVSSPGESVPAVPVNPSSPVSNKAEHYDKGKQFMCSECGRCYKGKYALKNHFKLHTGVGLYSCTECHKTFTVKQRLYMHQRTDSNPFVCSQCAKCFVCKTGLGFHMQVDHPQIRYRSPHACYLRCPVCTQDFQTKNDLEDHMKDHPELKSQYTCNECGKYFFYKANLKAHYRVHTGERPFSCLECGKTFVYKSHLVSHQRIHTGEGLTCRYCPMFFVERVRLVEHERTHTGEKPFACSECGRCFRRNYHLILHQRVHTNMWPFQCTLCGVHFTGKSAADRHYKKRRCKVLKGFS
ncbi:uncharacterized protein ACMZJ9_015377 isoform 1-T2 [Mantella aurantiaca]